MQILCLARHCLWSHCSAIWILFHCWNPPSFFCIIFTISLEMYTVFYPELLFVVCIKPKFSIYSLDFFFYFRRYSTSPTWTSWVPLVLSRTAEHIRATVEVIMPSEQLKDEGQSERECGQFFLIQCATCWWAGDSVINVWKSLNKSSVDFLRTDSSTFIQDVTRERQHKWGTPDTKKPQGKEKSIISGRKDGDGRHRVAFLYFCGVADALWQTTNNSITPPSCLPLRGEQLL